MIAFLSPTEFPFRSRPRTEPKGRPDRRLRIGNLARLLTLGLGLLVTGADAHAEGGRNFGAVGDGVIVSGNERSSR